MQINIQVKNLKKAMAQLKNLEKDLEPDFQEVVKGGAQKIREEAIKSIQSGAKSGIVYEKYNPRRTHRASAPGQAPASDTGNLVSKIIVALKDKDHTEVQSNAHYSAYLEYGTSKMEPRPFLLPAFEKSKKPIINAVFNRVKRKIEEIVK
jgi:HK97 gp10 family phage protein